MKSAHAVFVLAYSKDDPAASDLSQRHYRRGLGHDLPLLTADTWSEG